jgi:hypothetical protein
MSLATNEKPIYARVVNNGVGVLNAASAGALGADTNGVVVLTAGSAGSRVEAIVINTDDTAIVNVFLYILNSSTVKPLGIINVPLSSGNNASIPSVDALAGVGVTLQGMKTDSTGKRYLDLMIGDVLKASVLASMTAAKKAYVTALALDY